MVTNEIWVYIESHDGVVTDPSYEIIYAAKRLARQKDVSVNALYIGNPDELQLDEIEKYGVEKMYVMNHTLLTTYTTDTYVGAFAEVIQAYQPLALLLPGTTNCKDFAPRLAAHLQLGFTSDCVKFDWGKEQTLLMTRSIHKGRTHATYATHVAGTQLATVRPGSFPKAVPQATWGHLEVLPVKVDLQNLDNRTKVLKWIDADASTVDLSEAKMIVAGGRGAKNKEGFQNIVRLAEVIGASVGASRVATDEGWVPFERQIGQTGKVVAPALYIACGISGAVHHTMGIKDSDKIIAINTDKSAAIFGVSDLGLVGDMHEVLPLLIEKVSKYKAEKARIEQAQTQDQKVVG